MTYLEGHYFVSVTSRDGWRVTRYTWAGPGLPSHLLAGFVIYSPES
jgi:hypothetical protein